MKFNAVDAEIRLNSRYRMFRAVMIIVLILSPLNVARADIKKKISEKMAYYILSSNFGFGPGGGPYNYSEGVDKPFYDYECLNLDAHSCGYFAVNPWTGEVWDLWSCHKVSSAVSRRAQRKIKRRFTSEEMKQYRRLSRLKPSCD
jgi:hypothetical protein